MAKVTIADLDAASALDGTELVEVEQGGESAKTTTQAIADLAGGGASYLVYTALLSQSGTDAPVATVLENTLGGAVVWTRDDVGEYVGTLAGAFVDSKTWFSATCQYDNAYIAQCYWVDDDSFEFYVSDFAAQGADDWSKISIEIRVYP